MKTPLSVHIVVFLEWAFGCLFGFYSLMLLVFGFYGLIHLNFMRTLTSFGWAVLIGALSGVLFVTGLRLREGVSWAWKASWVIGAFVLLFGAWTIYEALYAKVHSPDDYFGLVFGPILIGCALLGMILLLLPQTREYLHSESSDEGEASL